MKLTVRANQPPEPPSLSCTRLIYAGVLSTAGRLSEEGLAHACPQQADPHLRGKQEPARLGKGRLAWTVDHAQKHAA